MGSHEDIKRDKRRKCKPDDRTRKVEHYSLLRTTRQIAINRTKMRMKQMIEMMGRLLPFVFLSPLTLTFVLLFFCFLFPLGRVVITWWTFLHEVRASVSPFVISTSEHFLVSSKDPPPFLTLTSASGSYREGFTITTRLTIFYWLTIIQFWEWWGCDIKEVF